MKVVADDTLKTQKKLELAQEYFREFFATCFWYFDPDLVVSEATLPLVVRGLETYGGHRGLRAAARLLE